MTPIASPVPFDFHGHSIRTVTGPDGEPWFIATDACRVLGLKNVAQAVTGNERSGALGIDVEDRAQADLYIRSASGVSQRRAFWIVNESGLYRLIFASKKPEAEAFKLWVCREVLPSIRKTGSYALPGQPAPQQTYVEQLEALISRLKAEPQISNTATPIETTP